MSDFTIAPDPDLWHEVPEPQAAQQFITDITRGLAGDDAAVAQAMAEAALAARETTDDLTLLLQEPASSLYAVASFALYSDRSGVATEKEALQLVTDGEIAAWEPAVAEVELGSARGYRVSEFLPAEDDPVRDSAFTDLHMTQTTYVLSIGGRLGTVSLTPAPAPAAGVILTLIEPVISTWEATA